MSKILFISVVVFLKKKENGNLELTGLESGGRNHPPAPFANAHTIAKGEKKEKKWLWRNFCNPLFLERSALYAEHSKRGIVALCAKLFFETLKPEAALKLGNETNLLTTKKTNFYETRNKKV